MTKLPFILVVLSLASLLGSQKKEIPGPLAEKGELLFSDDFARKDIGEKWQVSHDAFRIRDSVLIGKQVRDDHGAIGKVHVPMKDVVVLFRFKLAGSPRFNVVFDDKQHQESHAGHLIRVAVAKKQIRLGDDREGVMRKDIREMRLDPTKKRLSRNCWKGRGLQPKSILNLIAGIR